MRCSRHVGKYGSLQSTHMYAPRTYIAGAMKAFAREVCRNDVLNFGRLHFFFPDSRLALDLNTDRTLKEVISATAVMDGQLSNTRWCMEFILSSDHVKLNCETETGMVITGFVLPQARFDRHFVRDLTWSRHQLEELAERRFRAAQVVHHLQPPPTTSNHQ